MGTNVHEPDQFDQLFNSGRFRVAEQFMWEIPRLDRTSLTWRRLAMCQLMQHDGLGLALKCASNGIDGSSPDYIGNILRDVALHLVRFRPSGLINIRFADYEMSGDWSELFDLIMDELESMPHDQNMSACYMMIRGRKYFALGRYYQAEKMHRHAEARWKSTVYPNVQWMMNNRYHWYLARVGCFGARRSRIGLSQNLCRQILRSDPNWKRRQIVRVLWWFGRPALRLVR